MVFLITLSKILLSVPTLQPQHPHPYYVLYFPSVLFCLFLIYFLAVWVFIAAWAFSLVVGREAHSPAEVQGFSLRWLLVSECGLQGTQAAVAAACGSVAAAPGLQSPGSVVSRVLLLHGRWDLPLPGIQPVSSALAGGFFTTEPPGKPSLPSMESVIA